MHDRQLKWLALVTVLLAIVSMPVLADKAKPAGNGILPGSNSKDPINIDAAKLDYFDKEQKLVYTGNVVAVQGQSKLRTPSLVIFLMPKDTSSESGTPSSTNNEVRRMEAAGPVVMSQKDQVGTGDRGVYIKAENKVYLYGNVTLTQGPNVTKGDQLEYDLTTSQARVTGNVKSLFLPNNGNSGANEENGSKKTSKAAGTN